MSSNVALAELQAARNQLPIRAGGSKSSEDDNSFRRSSRIKAESFWSATSVTVILFLFLILAVFFVLGIGIPSWIVASRGSPQPLPSENGTVPCTCRDGLPGQPGQQGPPGEPGESITGPTGEPGPTGPPGECLANPACGQGPRGETGPTGPTGPQGRQGVKGDPGPQGDAGPSGPSGATGPSGPSGPQGAQGNPGLNGTCDCFNLPNVTVNNTLITGTLELDGVLSCGINASISANCRDACPNYSNCSLTARALALTGGSPTQLTVGQLCDAGDSVVQFGNYLDFNGTCTWQIAQFGYFSQIAYLGEFFQCFRHQREKKRR